MVIGNWYEDMYILLVTNDIDLKTINDHDVDDEDDDDDDDDDV